MDVFDRDQGAKTRLLWRLFTVPNCRFAVSRRVLSVSNPLGKVSVFTTVAPLVKVPTDQGDEPALAAPAHSRL